MIIDTHCHYNLDPLVNKWQQHWKEAQEAGVEKSIIIGTTVKSSEKATQLSTQEKNLYSAVGIHPNSWKSDTTPTQITTAISQLAQLLESSDKIVAIGETGLDYFRHTKEERQAGTLAKIQQEACKAHLELAKQHSLPVLLHVRDTQDTAYFDMLNLIKTTLPNPYPVVLHCVSGPKEYVESVVQLGGYIGVAGNVTYPSANTIREIVSSVPQEAILLETDAPYLPPQQFRGHTCEPKMIQLTGQFMEQELGISLTKIKDTTLKLFPLLNK